MTLTPVEALRELLAAEDRDASPGAAPLVALAADEDPELRAAVEGVALRVAELQRRGVWHGEWAELPHDLPPALGGAKGGAGQRAGADPRAVWRARFDQARPIVLPGFVDPDEFRAELDDRMRLFDALQLEAGGLREFLHEARAALAPEFTTTSIERLETDRDLERATLLFERPGSSQRFKDLWVKSAWLSNHDADASLRVRLSFGREVENDASRDVARHLAVATLATRLLPECALAHENEVLGRLLHEWVGGECFLSQHIAYWNAPEGGALFHHDAFDEPIQGGQRGVVYMQLTGTSAWLALSLQDLATRVEEFAAALAEGAAPWIQEALWPDPTARAAFLHIIAHRHLLEAELAQPGCGALAGLVNRGPEFTGWLADAGHAWLLDPGDVIVLPNHGLGATCMHSVFCASDEPGYALSMAIRERRPAAPSRPQEGTTDAASGLGRDPGGVVRVGADRRRGRGARRGPSKGTSGGPSGGRNRGPARGARRR
ncbi:MAG: hypothetical protein R3F49_01345 [Planctomycetota bacterium]